MQTFRWLIRASWMISLLAALLAWARPADAAFRGANGMIAFAGDRDQQGNCDIYLMNPDRSGVKRLTDDPAWNSNPAWSPDSSRIAFTSFRDDQYEIYVVNADGTGQVNLTNHFAADRSPAWSADGSKIAFASDRADYDHDIYVMHVDGSGQANLTRDSGATDSDPAWSPDGSKIAFVKVAGPGPDVDVCVMGADGAEQINLTDTPTPETEWAPDWSPDGSKIAFGTIASADGAPLDMKVMNADGTGTVTVLKHKVFVGGAGSPAWSPDGTKIAFVRKFGAGATGTFDILVINADGSGEVNLTNTPEASESDPDWQPLRMLPPTGGPGPQGGDWDWPAFAWLGIAALLAVSGLILVQNARAPSAAGCDARLHSSARHVAGGRTYHRLLSLVRWLRRRADRGRPEMATVNLRRLLLSASFTLFVALGVACSAGGQPTSTPSPPPSDTPESDTEGETPGPQQQVLAAVQYGVDVGGPDKPTSTILLVDVGSGERREIAHFSWTIADLSWSPDGRHIAACTLGAGGSLWIVPVNGGEPNGLRGYRCHSPVWSPDGEWVTFDSPHHMCTSDVYVVRRDGTGLRNITNSGEEFNAGPSWSPNGSRIAFAKTPCENTLRDGDREAVQGLYVVDFEDGSLQRLTDGGSWPQWSPDGTAIAFDTVGLGGLAADSAVYIVDPDGGNRRMLKEPAASPKWSSDGAWIASLYPTQRLEPEGEKLDLVVIRPDGREERGIAGPLATSWAPWEGYDWSPDGKMIAYVVRDAIEAASVGTSETITVSRDARLTPLVAWAPEGVVLPESTEPLYPDWNDHP